MVGSVSHSAVFEADNLSCRRSGRCVFRGVSFVLEAGGALVVMGANGSGKSTLLRVLAGLLPHVGGSLRWQGEILNPFGEGWRERVRYVGHLDACKPEWTVGETLAYWGDLYRATLRDDPFCLLPDVGTGRLVRFLSAGQRRKLALTRLCLSGGTQESRVWLLDEPMTALDQVGQDALVNLIESHRKAAGLVVIASHQGVPLSRQVVLSLSV
ncbi:MAG: heme ABC exporter ATP-binding protein CcmA [Bdellovibrionales bacterium]